MNLYEAIKKNSNPYSNAVSKAINYIRNEYNELDHEDAENLLYALENKSLSDKEKVAKALNVFSRYNEIGTDDRYFLLSILNVGESKKSSTSKSVKKQVKKLTKSSARVKEVEPVDEFQKKFMDYCKGKIKDLGNVKIKTSDLEDVDEDDVDDTISARVDLLYSDGTQAINPEDTMDLGIGYENVVRRSGGQFFDGGEMDAGTLNHIADLNFKSIDTRFYNDLMEQWEDWDMSARFDSDETLNESEFLVNKTPYGFTEVYYKGYTISNMFGDISVNVDGDEVHCNSIDEAISTIDGLESFDYSIDDDYEFLKGSYDKQGLDSSSSLIRTSDVNEVKRLFSESDLTDYERDAYGIDEDGYDENGDEWIHCDWCEDLTPKSECKKELNLGWLCKHCQDALYSRGEKAVYEVGE